MIRPMRASLRECCWTGEGAIFMVKPADRIWMSSARCDAVRSGVAYQVPGVQSHQGRRARGGSMTRRVLETLTGIRRAARI